MTTFSQVVDTLVAESRRGDMVDMIATYINATIRDVHFNKANNMLVQLKSNLFETEITTNVDERFTWLIAKPQLFAKMAAVYYPNQGVYASERNPSSMFAFNDAIGSQHSWYRTGEYIAFNGYGGVDESIWLAWYEYPRRLVYYPPSTRPVTWSDETERFIISAAYDISAEKHQEGLDLSTNWLLQRWPDLILEGGRAKLYKRLKDEIAMRAAYSAFESARGAMVAAETYEASPTYMR